MVLIKKFFKISRNRMKLSLVTHRVFPLQSPRSLLLKPSKFPLQTLKSPSSSRTINVHKISKRRLNLYCYFNYNYSFARSASGTATMCTSPVCVYVKDQIDLTAKEKQIFDRLLEVLRHFNLQTQLRVAGGWVRDKVSTVDRMPIVLVLVFGSYARTDLKMLRQGTNDDVCDTIM